MKWWKKWTDEVCDSVLWWQKEWHDQKHKECFVVIWMKCHSFTQIQITTIKAIAKPHTASRRSCSSRSSRTAYYVLVHHKFDVGRAQINFLIATLFISCWVWIRHNVHRLTIKDEFWFRKCVLLTKFHLQKRFIAKLFERIRCFSNCVSRSAKLPAWMMHYFAYLIPNKQD